MSSSEGEGASFGAKLSFLVIPAGLQPRDEMAPPSLLLLLPRPVGVTAAAPPAVANHSSLIVSRCRFSSSSSSSSSISKSSTSRIRSSGSRSRRWWSDEQLEEDEDDEFDFESEFDEEEDGDGAFGAGWLLEEPWFSKVFRVYGYVLPLILASMLAATGLRGFLLAMAIPLAQSAASFLLSNLAAATSTGGGFGFGRRRDRDSSYWYRQDDDGSEYHRSDWEEEFSSRSNDTSAYRDEQQQPSGTDRSAEATADKSDEGRSTTSAGFGGWDELDQYQYQYQSSSSSSSRRSASEAAAGADTNTAATGAGDAARARRRQPATEAAAAATTRRRGGGRRRAARAAGGGGAAVRYRQSPLLMRLLVALFPFLGPWFRLL